MRIIKAVLVEPVGCLAEFPAEEFNEIATTLFDVPDAVGASGSDAYWRLLDLIQQSGDTLTAAKARAMEALEVQAVDRAQLYEDVAPALAELRAMHVTLMIASSLSAVAVARFLERFSLGEYFPAAAVWTRGTARGVKAAPLAAAIASASLDPAHVMALGDTSAALQTAKEVGANAILMINDYEEGRRLAMQAPTGAVVSLHELPDAIRLVAEGAKVPRPSPPPGSFRA